MESFELNPIWVLMFGVACFVSWVYWKLRSISDSYLKVKKSDDSRGLSATSTYRIIKTEASLLCYQRHLIENDFGTRIYVCDYDVKVI